MGKVISESLQGTFGVDIFPAISLVIFILLFVGLIIYVIKADKNFIDKMKNFPFEEESTNTNNIE